MEFRNLDERTRKLMIAEVDHDVAAGRLYLSDRLTETGAQEWERLLRAAAGRRDAGDLALNLNTAGRLRSQMPRRTPSGGTTMAKMPHNAAQTLAEGEFNRFYIRAVCRRAIEDGIPHVVVYRARSSSSPRPDSEGKVGAHVDPKQLLADLREHPGIDTALGLPNGPNSGLSVHLPPAVVTESA